MKIKFTILSLILICCIGCRKNNEVITIGFEGDITTDIQYLLIRNSLKVLKNHSDSLVFAKREKKYLNLVGSTYIDMDEKEYLNKYIDSLDNDLKGIDKYYSYDKHLKEIKKKIANSKHYNDAYREVISFENVLYQKLSEKFGPSGVCSNFLVGKIDPKKKNLKLGEKFEARIGVYTGLMGDNTWRIYSKVNQIKGNDTILLKRVNTDLDSAIYQNLEFSPPEKGVYLVNGFIRVFTTEKQNLDLEYETSFTVK
jgi:hypothetical protein